MSTYNQLLHCYKKEFNGDNLDDQTVKLFLFELCNEHNVNLYLDLDKEALQEIQYKFNKGLVKLIEGEPLNYVLGYSYFFGYKMKVDNNVLIPRYETEELVGLILANIDESYNDLKEITMCDVGTGSGAIAIALTKEEKKIKMYASDISKEALDVAKENADNNKAKIEFMCGDMLKPLIEKGIKLDILVSNPPYIPSDEVMEESVIDYEPHVALFGGEDGLKFYREIFVDAPKVLNEKAMMFFEIGYNQKEALTNLALSYFPKAKVDVYKDINKKDRMMRIVF